MYSAVLVACLISVAQALPHSVQMFEIAPAKKAPVKLRYDPYEETWAAFKQKHGKTYSTGEEEIDRMKIFLDNVKLIEQHNWEYFNMKKSYYMDINQFTDMTFEEYKKYNRLQARDSSRNATIQCTQFQPPLNWLTPAEVDWRKEGYVTPVKNQGQCGSCWSFSTTGSMEGQHFRLTKVLDSLSEQQLVDCSGKFGNQGCDGGLMDQAFEYINSVGGLESESNYPYEAVQHKCNFKKKEIVTETYVKGCQDIQSGSESDLMQAVASQGPISVAIDAGHPSFQSYSGGVYDEPGCSSSELDHGVLVVGYGSSSGQEYWLVKNSWGTSWGDEGYIMMTRNKDNQCGIATAASFPQLSSS